MERVGRVPAWLYQRYRSLWDRLVPAAGMAGLFWWLAQATGVLSPEWRLFIAGGILIAGLFASLVGYVAFVAALAYPLYTISIYVAALAITALTLPAFFLTRHLSAVVLALSVPAFSMGRLGPAVPLLAGLWWAEGGGAGVGVGSALWLKLCAGMCGADPDFVRLGGTPLVMERVVERFGAANSLQTLVWLVQPLAPDSRTLLLHILQVMGWGLAGYAAGLMRQRMSRMARPTVGLMAALGAGLLGLNAGVILLPLALGLDVVASVPTLFLVECLGSALLVMGLYALRRYLMRPVLDRPAEAPLDVATSEPGGVVEPPPSRRPALGFNPRPRDEEHADIIMIDLD
jgi:hypothetical protein